MKVGRQQHVQISLMFNLRFKHDAYQTLMSRMRKDWITGVNNRIPSTTDLLIRKWN